MQNPYLVTPAKRRIEEVDFETPRSRATSSTHSYYSRPSSAASSHTQRQHSKRARRAQEKRDKEEEEICRKLEGLEYLGRTTRTRDLDKELRFAEPDALFQQFMRENQVLFEGVNPDDWCFVEANSVVELNHLEKFCRHYQELSPKFETAVELAADYVAHALALPRKIPFPTKDDLEEVRYIGSKYAGLEYALQDMKTRVAADRSAQMDAEWAWDQLMNGINVPPHVNRIGGRGKLVRKEKLEKTVEKPMAGRLIFMTSQRDLKLNGVTEQLLTQSYKEPQYPISVGKAWWHGGTKEFVDRFADYKMFSCFDAAKFDSSLPPWLIRLALDILRDQFVDGMHERYDAYWDFVFDGLVYAPVYLDNGMQFRRQGGSTSGHSFNTLMQSVCTLIICYTCYIYNLGVERAEITVEEVHCESLGDDQHTGAKGEAAELTIEENGPLALECFGVDWLGDKSFNTDILVDMKEGEFQGTQYLGKYFRNLEDQVGGLAIQAVVPYRPFEETVLRLLYPERGEMGVTESWMRGIGHYADGAGNTRTRQMLEAYLDWLEPMVPLDEISWSEKWARKFTGGDPLATVPVPTRRISYEEWLGLVILDDSQ